MSENINEGLPVPQTRSEKFLAKIAGEDQALPIPQSREEMFLKAIAENGSGGGGGGDDTFVVTATVAVDGTTVTFDKTAAETAAAINAKKPVIMMVYNDGNGESKQAEFAGDTHGQGYEFFTKTTGDNVSLRALISESGGSYEWTYFTNDIYPNMSLICGGFTMTSIPYGKVFELGNGWVTERKIVQLGNLLDTMLYGALQFTLQSGSAVISAEDQDDGTVFGVVSTIFDNMSGGKGCSVELDPEVYPIDNNYFFDVTSACKKNDGYIIVFSGVLTSDVNGSPLSAYSYYATTIVVETKYVELSEEYSYIVTVKCDKVDGTIVS